MALIDYINTFASNVVDKAKSNLIKEDKGGGPLEESLSYKVNVSKNSFQVDIYAEDYWKYVDAGVKGVGGSKANGDNWKVKRVTNNKFKYRDKMPPTKVFNGWSIKKGSLQRERV